MPWRESCAMDERMRFIVDHLSGEWTMSELCDRYGISRQTGYKWVGRYRAEGAAGLVDRSRAAKAHGRATPAAFADADCLAARGAAELGPAQDRRQAAAAASGRDWPAASTAGEMLKRAGLVSGRRRRRRAPPRLGALTAPERPNHVWGVDHKGWMRLGDGTRCEPLTVTDSFSRYLLQRVGHLEHARGGGAAAVRAGFREYGLPEVIRSDSGPPFASPGLTGLTALGGLVGEARHPP